MLADRKMSPEACHTQVCDKPAQHADIKAQRSVVADEGGAGVVSVCSETFSILKLCIINTYSSITAGSLHIGCIMSKSANEKTKSFLY